MRRVLLGILVSLLLLAVPARAELRVPQVPLADPRPLTDLLRGQGQITDVSHEQLAEQSWITNIPASRPSVLILLELVKRSPGATFGLYDPGLAIPEPHPVFGSSAAPGWFANVILRRDPPNPGVKVIVFDESGVLQSSVTYPLADYRAYAFYSQGPVGTFFSEDVRNAAGVARGLAFLDTTLPFSVGRWLAFDTASTGTFDADCVYYEVLLPPLFVHKTNWRALKERFR